MRQYRHMFALPGVPTLMVLTFFARIPLTAGAMILTLHVAIGLGRGYGAAGLVGGAATVGIALGAPVMGRVVDRLGLRVMVIITAAGESLFWLTATTLPYPVLMGVTFLGGFLVLPAMSIGRQAIAALVPEGLRRTAYSLDSISTELSYMVGPAMAVLIATQLSTTAAMRTMALSVAAIGLALVVVNPATRSKQEIADDTGDRPPRRQWLTPRLLAVLLVCGGAVFALAGTEIAIVAQLREVGELSWTGLVVAGWAAWSAIGGLVYGALTRSFRPTTLMTWLGALTIPIGLAGEHWWVLLLAVLPAGLLCAPTLAASAEQVSRLAPAAVRGEAMGLQSSAMTLGAAAGAPLVGFVVDNSSPVWGFAVAGLGGLLVTATALTVRIHHQRHVPSDALPVQV
jgi:MFS family permease